MDKLSVDTSIAPEVIIEKIQGNLSVRGWDRPQVMVDSKPEETVLDEQDDVVHLSCKDNCQLRVPHSATVQIETIQGNAQFTLLEDQLTIEKIQGNLALRGVAAVLVDVVQGELSAKDLSGDLQVNQTKGNVSVRGLYGRCSLEEVQGNLTLRDVDSDVNAIVRGNARLRLGGLLGSQYDIHATGNIQCRLSGDADVELSLNSEGQMIKVRLPDDKQTYRESNRELTLGSGETKMSLSAGGTIHLTVQEDDWSYAGELDGDFDPGLPDDYGQKLAQQIEIQIQTQMDDMNRQINEQMADLAEKIGQAELPPEDIERITAQALKESERDIARSQEKMRRSQEKMERKLEAARRRYESKARTAENRRKKKGKGWNFDLAGQTPAPPKDPVSEEERLMILRMLEQKKISMEEADQLLDALEGKES